MASQTLGRTNTAYPPVWLSLGVPTEAESIPGFIEAAIGASTVLDVSVQPALWGGRLRHESCPLLVSGGMDIERATDQRHAADLIQAEMLQILSALGHDRIEFYCLKLRRALEEFQLAGAFEALESARQDSHIRHLGLWIAGPAYAILPSWQFHDAFEAVVVSSVDIATVAPFAADRRVGVIEAGPLRQASDVWLAPVRSVEEINTAMAQAMGALA